MNSKVVDYFGQKKTLYETFCGTCNKSIYLRKHLLNKPRYCSRKCSAISKHKWVDLQCALCKVSFKRLTTQLHGHCKSGLRFCSKSCKAKAQRVEGLLPIMPKHFKGGRCTYRSRAIREYGAVCKKCSYSEKETMLDVDHIDSNRQNNKLENLQVLCVWCHALKTRGIEE